MDLVPFPLGDEVLKDGLGALLLDLAGDDGVLEGANVCVVAGGLGLLRYLALFAMRRRPWLGARCRTRTCPLRHPTNYYNYHYRCR